MKLLACGLVILLLGVSAATAGDFTDLAGKDVILRSTRFKSTLWTIHVKDVKPLDDGRFWLSGSATSGKKDKGDLKGCVLKPNGEFTLFVLKEGEKKELRYYGKLTGDPPVFMADFGK